MNKEEFIADIKTGKGLSEELQDEIAKEQLEDSTNKLTRQEWLEERKKGIGGSDAAVVLGKSKWKTNVELWEEKTGRRNAPDISNKPCVRYGIEAEEHIRQMFSLNYPEYEVKHKENTIIKHPKYPFLFASLDGILVNKETGEMGILEVKTTEILRSMQNENWKDENIPDAYYCQVLHYLNVTGFSFVKLVAELKYSQDYQIRKTYTILREEVEEELKYLEQEEIKFWNDYVVKDIRPPLDLPQI